VSRDAPGFILCALFFFIQFKRMGYDDRLALSFITAFLFTPFGSVGYFYMLFLIFYEAFFAFTYADPYSLSERFVVITVSVLGRVLGEIIWPFLVTLGAGHALM
jgi:hypothetical protein